MFQTQKKPFQCLWKISLFLLLIAIFLNPYFFSKPQIHGLNFQLPDLILILLVLIFQHFDFFPCRLQFHSVNSLVTWYCFTNWIIFSSLLFDGFLKWSFLFHQLRNLGWLRLLVGLYVMWWIQLFVNRVLYRFGRWF